MKIKTIIMILILALLPLLIRAEETCEMNQVVIESVDISNKVGKSDVFEDTSVEENNVLFNLSLSDIGDSIEHKIVLNNTSSEDFIISKSSLKLNSDYINYTLRFEDDDSTIKANSSKVLYLKAEYKEEIPDELFESNVYSENTNGVVSLSTKAGIIENLINPKTGVKSYVTLLLIILVLSIIAYRLIKKKDYSHSLVIIIGALLIIPMCIHAVCNYEINVEVNLEVEEPIFSKITPNFYEYYIDNNEVTITNYKKNEADTYVSYDIKSEAKCKNYFRELWTREDYDFEESDLETLCSGEETSWGETIEEDILTRFIPKSDYRKAGLRNVYQPINIYYNVTNNNKCINYIKELMLDNGLDEEYANTYAPKVCSNGHDNEGHALDDYIYYLIREEEYKDAGISINEKITPTDIIIPETIEGKPVTKLGFYSFNEKGLTSVVLPSTLKEIGGYQEDSGAFIYNNITSIVIPEGVEVIGDDAFQGNKLENVTLPSTLKSIGERAFRNNKLETINIPYGVEVIGLGAFEKNILTSLDIPESVIYLGIGSFNDNKLNDSQAFIYARNDENDDGIAEIDSTTIVSYGGANKDVIIPNGVVTLADFAVPYGSWYSSFGRIDLTSVTIPPSVMIINSYAFTYDSLSSIIVQGKTSASQFSKYPGRWDWDSNVTCVKDNTTNVENGCITWEGQ